jgi:hypothetical protein
MPGRVKLGRWLISDSSIQYMWTRKQNPSLTRVAQQAVSLLLVVFAVFAVHGQEAAPLRFGEDVDGYLDGLTLQQTYSFDGRRGEFLAIRVTPTEGNLDPVLTVVDGNGAVLATLDDGAGRGAVLDTLRVPRNGLYYLVVSRFGGELGITGGNYVLRVERVGVSSESGSSLRYDDTVLNAITDNNPQHYYTFQARRGDILNIDMQRVSGDLDPYLQIVDSTGAVIAEGDDVPGSATLDAAVDGLVIDNDGTYVIIATRYGEAAGQSTGSFVLSLAESDVSGLGNTLQTAQTIPDGEFVPGEITASQTSQYFTFTANQDDLIRVQMDRVSGSLDAYLILLDADLNQVATDDDSGGGQNAQLSNLRLPRTGLYYIQATRFGGAEAAEGGTVGRYRLRLERLGGAFAEIQADAQPLRYGSSLTGVINNDKPEDIYVFYGTVGDVITVAMNRGDGNLDPVVAVLGEDLQPLASDDDSGGGQNARIERFVLGRTGVYYVRATRYSGTGGDSQTRGSYILVLAQRFD